MKEYKKYTLFLKCDEEKMYNKYEHIIMDHMKDKLADLHFGEIPYYEDGWLKVFQDSTDEVKAVLIEILKENGFEVREMIGW